MPSYAIWSAHEIFTSVRNRFRGVVLSGQVWARKIDSEGSGGTRTSGWVKSILIRGGKRIVDPLQFQYRTGGRRINFAAEPTHPPPFVRLAFRQIYFAGESNVPPTRILRGEDAAIPSYPI